MPARTSHVVLTWQAPSTNADGTLCAPLKEFRVYHRTLPTTPYPIGCTGSFVRIAANAHEIALDVPVGLHWYAVTAVSMEGQESAPSRDYFLQVAAVPSSEISSRLGGMVLTVR